jgi:hypothetical protein
MIISASRRTDIPAFYSKWFINRIRAGYCTVPNPFNLNQISKVSLNPEDVEIIIFWTRNPQPLIPYLKELDNLGYSYYFQYTILNYPRIIDSKSPSIKAAIKTFCDLAEKVGNQRIIWRYDPIIFSELTDAQFHYDSYKHIAESIRGYTQRSVISIMDKYNKNKKRMSQLAENGAALLPDNVEEQPWFDGLMNSLVDIANRNGMEIVSCAEKLDLNAYGIRAGKCVDEDFIEQVFGKKVVNKKDPFQRKECGCVVSKDIGIYDTCLYGCQYCYATRSFELAYHRYVKHDPTSPSLIGRYDPIIQESKATNKTASIRQLKLWNKNNSQEE